MHEIEVVPRSTSAFQRVLDATGEERLNDSLGSLRSRVGRGRVVWHVNSTATGGGVAEMLSTLLPYEAGAGIDVRWVVIGADDRFFELTKRVHNRLHDDEGDGGPLGGAEHALYEEALHQARHDLESAVRSGDIVVLHDPQTAGLVSALKRAGAHVVWRCHVGVDEPGPLARSAWDFLRPEIDTADAWVFSRAAHVWAGLPSQRVVILAPCIDVLSPKNHPLDDPSSAAILSAAGLWPNGEGDARVQLAGRSSGPIVVQRQARVVEDAPIPAHARLVLQVSRWDRLKDAAGVITGFTESGPSDDRVHLVVAGPAVEGVSDDPEGAAVFDEVRGLWQGLASDVRKRVHLACLPMDDPDENGIMVNALQQRADVVVQKSIAEGFGLTVAEAMWKERPVVATGVGGIQDQIVDGESGILIDDPADLETFGRAVARLLDDADASARMGKAAHQRVCDRFLPAHHFTGELAMLDRVLAS
jgi:trehalose synthase